MNNRWSDAARLAALAVRKARAFAANPQGRGNAMPRQGGLAPKPTAQLPSGSGYVPANGGAGTQSNNGLKVLEEKKKLPEGNAFIRPNIFYSETGPQRPSAQRPAPARSVALTPTQRKAIEAENFQAERPGLATPVKVAVPSTVMAPQATGIGPSAMKKATGGTRVVIGGIRYTVVGDKLVRDAFRRV